MKHLGLLMSLFGLVIVILLGSVGTTGPVYAQQINPEQVLSTATGEIYLLDGLAEVFGKKLTYMGKRGAVHRLVFNSERGSVKAKLALRIALFRDGKQAMGPFLLERIRQTSPFPGDYYTKRVRTSDEFSTLEYLQIAMMPGDDVVSPTRQDHYLYVIKLGDKTWLQLVVDAQIKDKNCFPPEVRTAEQLVGVFMKPEQKTRFSAHFKNNPLGQKAPQVNLKMTRTNEKE